MAELVKNLPANSGCMGSIPGLEGSPGEGNGNPLQYSCLENSMDRAAWWARSQKNWTWLSTHECWEPKWYFLRPDPKRGHKMVPTLPIHHPGLLISMVTLHTQLWYTWSQFLEDSLLYRTLSSLAHMCISTNSSQVPDSSLPLRGRLWPPELHYLWNRHPDHLVFIH